MQRRMRALIMANHIQTLTQQRDDARATISGTRDALNELLGYLGSDKFSGGGDYVHIRTDLMPKLLTLRLTLCN